jgi:GrpB-like predicted nucleotidyltransferase (UPF0157 family)
MLFSKESSPEFRTHHLNLTEPDSMFWKNQLLFRDCLRENNQLASEYILLKNQFVDYYAQTKNIDVEWKSAFVARVLEIAKDNIKKIS